VSTVKENVD